MERDRYHYIVSWDAGAAQYIACLLEDDDYRIHGATPELALANLRKALWRDLRELPQPIDPFVEETLQVRLRRCRQALEELEQEIRYGLFSTDFLGGVTIYQCADCDIEVTEEEDFCEHIRHWIARRQSTE